MNLDDHMKALALARKFLDEECLPLVDAERQDVGLAVFRIADACLTRATSALASWSFGDIDAATRASRFIRECRLLTSSLACLPDEARKRYARQFFRDGRITIDARRYKKQLSVGLSTAALAERIEAISELNRGFARGDREDFRSIAFGTKTDSDRTQDTVPPNTYGDTRTFDFSNFIITPTTDVAINSLAILNSKSKPGIKQFEFCQKTQGLVIIKL